MKKRINKILWHGDELEDGFAKAPTVSVSHDGLDGLNEGELFISNNEADPALFIRTSSGKIARIGDSKLFNLVKDEEGNLYIETPYTFVSKRSISALGKGEDFGSEGGISYDRLDSWEDYKEGSGAVLSADLGYDLLIRIQNIGTGDGDSEGSTVSFIQALTSGKLIGTLSIDGVATNLYAPATYDWAEIKNAPDFIQEITAAMIEAALGYTPYDANNPKGFATETWAKDMFTPITEHEGLTNRVASLEADSALSVTTKGEGNAVTSLVKEGTEVTATKGGYVPTSAGTAGYVLQSTGSVPTWMAQNRLNAGYVNGYSIASNVAAATFAAKNFTIDDTSGETWYVKITCGYWNNKEIIFDINTDYGNIRSGVIFTLNGLNTWHYRTTAYNSFNILGYSFIYSGGYAYLYLKLRGYYADESKFAKCSVYTSSKNSYIAVEKVTADNVADVTWETLKANTNYIGGSVIVGGELTVKDIQVGNALTTLTEMFAFDTDDEGNKYIRTKYSFSSDRALSSLGFGGNGSEVGGSTDWGAVPTDIVPTSDKFYTLGTSDKAWKAVYANGIYVGNVEISAVVANIQGTLGSVTADIYALRQVSAALQEKNTVQDENIAALQQSTFGSSENEDYYRLTWYTSSGGARNVDIPTYTGKGFSGIEEVEGVFMSDYKMVYDILDYVDAKAGSSTVDLSGYYTKEQTDTLFKNYVPKLDGDSEGSLMDKQDNYTIRFGFGQLYAMLVGYNNTLDTWSIDSEYGSAWFTDYVRAAEFTQSSDATKKNVTGDAELSLDAIADAPLKYYTWKEGRDRGNQVGTLAQYWQEAMPEVTSGEEGKNLGVNYGVLGTAMGISLARELRELKAEVLALREELKTLKGV